MFGRATIRLGIGPHSSVCIYVFCFFLFSFLMLSLADVEAYMSIYI